jgi:hypothetical protein
MKLNNFIKELEIALVERGVPEELSKKHVANLYRSFTSDDLSEIESIESREEINALADSISVILNKNKINKTDVANVISVTNEPPVPKTASDLFTEPHMSNGIEQSEPHGLNHEINSPLYSEPEFDYVDNHREPVPTTRGITIFWVGLFVTLPITLALLGVIFGAFAGAFVSLVGLIIAAVAVLIALVALGAAVSLVGIIYGITQLFTFPAAGIYEIGLGVMVAGTVLFVSILIYNFAIRFVPWVSSKLALT